MKIPAMLAALLPPMPTPKAPKGQTTIPGIRTQIDPRESAISRQDRLLATTNRLNARTLQDTYKTITELSKSSPDLASSISFMLRTGIPEGYKIFARDMDGRINPQATGLANELLRRITFMGNADGSFNDAPALQSLSEMLGLELLLTGAMCAELALDKARVPSVIAPVAVSTLKIYDEDRGYKLVQVVGGEEIDLDIPTIFYVAVDQLATEAYSSSYLESAIQPILADIDYNNDVRRLLKRSVMPRLQAVIDSEKVRKLCPPEILQDAAKFKEYKEGLMLEISAVLNNAAPEDALVTYDSIEYSYLEGSMDSSAIVERMQKVLNGKLASGAKTLPVVLGHGSNSNASSTEAMLYVKQADMLRRKLNEMYSKVLTMACRLMGQDVFVEFKYDVIDLRPESELEAYYLMEQSRVLEQLSLGMISDEEACIRLTGNLPPAGYKPLSGTMFRAPQKADGGGNPDSNTSAMGQTLKPKTPTAPKSQQ